MRQVVYVFLFLTVIASAAYGQTNVPADPTLFNWGFLLSQILQAILVLIIPSIAVIVGSLAVRAFKWFGVQMTQQQRDRLQDVVVNGINYAGHQLEGQVNKFPPAQIRNKILAIVLDYVQEHGVDAVKELGLALDSPKLPSAIAARVARAINDPLSPTPSWLTPPEVLAMGRTRQAPSTGTDGVEQRPVNVQENIEDTTTTATTVPPTNPRIRF